MTDLDPNRSGRDESNERVDDAQRETDDETGQHRPAGGPSALDARLPDDLRTALGRFLGGEPVDTLGEWVAAVRRETDGPITAEDLCHASEETPHWGVADGERYHFLCFYDAVALAAIDDRPVDIRTESPDGEVVEARAIGTDELTVTPDEAVFSFGVDADAVADSDDGPALRDAYEAVCPYVKAFPSRAAYERWAERVDAPTVAAPLAGATELAAALVAESETDN